jgi:hypothetical protein
VTEISSGHLLQRAAAHLVAREERHDVAAAQRPAGVAHRLLVEQRGGNGICIACQLAHAQRMRLWPRGRVGGRRRREEERRLEARGVGAGCERGVRCGGRQQQRGQRTLRQVQRRVRRGEHGGGGSWERCAHASCSCEMWPRRAGSGTVHRRLVITRRCGCRSRRQTCGSRHAPHLIARLSMAKPGHDALAPASVCQHRQHTRYSNPCNYTSSLARPLASPRPEAPPLQVWGQRVSLSLFSHASSAIRLGTSHRQRRGSAPHCAQQKLGMHEPSRGLAIELRMPRCGTRRSKIGAVRLPIPRLCAGAPAAGRRASRSVAARRGNSARVRGRRAAMLRHARLLPTLTTPAAMSKGE